jgi:carboxyl-terminal processing protease
MKTHKFPIERIVLYFSLLVLIFLSSCRKDEVIEPDPVDTGNPNAAVNETFYDLMKDWYFWNTQIPEINPSTYSSPSQVLEAIRKRPEDRWSYITGRSEFEAYFRDARMVGYGFGSAWDAQENLRVMFVFNKTQMYQQGVRRSWVIEAINGLSVSPGSNVNSLLGANNVGVTNTFRFRKPDGTRVDLAIAKQEVVMNTVLHYEIIPYQGLNVGYMVLNGFTTPTIAELDSVFRDFAASGIDEFILDLRYNGGGQTNVANHLASLIAGSSVADQLFAKYIYNADRAAEFNRVDTFLTVPNSVNVHRLITIATRATASASEMVINGLRPYMDVKIIGDNTYGKPMGMNAWTYGDYAFIPITFKTANADNYGDYFNGLAADFRVRDDLSREFGNPEEASLKQALAFIATGVTKSEEVFQEVRHKQPREYMTGFRRYTGAH